MRDNPPNQAPHLSPAIRQAIELLEHGEVDDAIRVLEHREPDVPAEQTTLDVERSA